ncbi:Formyltetrahydrofolate deformylase [Paraconexibacter sp. AEG42_29]|uniref:Formyltetrahydrofolate deformylase n=1 Tax=Paraconexibacter sp. AEG42_29 TaxID=2997339 RepID=A0AAU7AX99_9ACTN
MSDERARLLIDCPDAPGIVAAVSGFLAAAGANIVESDQHSTAASGGHFFMRMTFDLPRLGERLADLRTGFAATVADHFSMAWRLVPESHPRRVAILASREPHCLLDLLWRAERGTLGGEVTAVISNHPDHRDTVERMGLTYHHVPVTRDTKPESEAALLDLLSGTCDLVVLARYMQILSGSFLAQVGVPVINIHHSFLPAFVGAAPYQQALDRGVKIVGATAHYVTEELDSGPIIEQDVVRIDHRADVDELARLGADVERLVLGRAVRWHLDDRVIAHDGSTVVF